MVLGANDGLISVASLTIGIASSGAESSTTLPENLRSSRSSISAEA